MLTVVSNKFSQKNPTPCICWNRTWRSQPIFKTNRNLLYNLETKATDGNPVFTPRQLERFKQFTKREHKIDITPLLKGEEIIDSGWTAKEQAIQEDFIW